MPNDPNWTCPSCGSHTWVAAADRPGGRRYAQCVPCGCYDHASSADDLERNLEPNVVADFAEKILEQPLADWQRRILANTPRMPNPAPEPPQPPVSADRWPFIDPPEWTEPNPAPVPSSILDAYRVTIAENVRRRIAETAQGWSATDGASTVRYSTFDEAIDWATRNVAVDGYMGRDGFVRPAWASALTDDELDEIEGYRFAALYPDSDPSFGQITGIDRRVALGVAALALAGVLIVARRLVR